MKAHMSLIAGALVLVGCGAPPPEEATSDDEQGLAARDRGEVGGGAAPTKSAGPKGPLPVVNGTFSTTPSWVVGLVVGNGSCTGWVVNEHWILTAGHCFAGQADGTEITIRRATGQGITAVIYQGPASFHRHPDFANTETHDAGLVRLWSHGLPVDLTGQARMYSDLRRVWKESSPAFISAGWGRSLPDPNSAGNCIAGGAFALRTSQSLPFDRTTTDVPAFVSAPLGNQFPCSGDSGSPWLASRGGDLLGFAIHSRRNGSPLKARASTLADNVSWIESTIVAGGTVNRYGQYCYERDSGGFRWRQCDEIARGWGQLKRETSCIQVDSLAAGSASHVAACGVSTSIPTQAFGLVPSGQIQVLGPNLCLEATSTTNLSPIKVAICNSSLNQRFANSPAGELRLGLDWNKCVTSVRNDFVIDLGGGVLTQALVAPAPAPAPVTDNVATLQTAALAADAGALQAEAEAAPPAAQPPAVAGPQALAPFKAAAILVADCNGSPSQKWTWQ